ncbi:hypothetical protein [Clostridium sp. FP1]|uniref:hypothetical protein n=1 Tax=Clostridium sp. FP1 TaxID=2724076 RepID=UPI0013E954FD|nr:hypothetical protein [Clostridium sp. FP1]MBZ9635995.1 hypothetical protein [Clostridium sp. FP1]
MRIVICSRGLQVDKSPSEVFNCSDSGDDLTIFPTSKPVTFNVSGIPELITYPN